MHLPENLRERLKKPLGILLKDSDVTEQNLLRKIPSGSFVISVGDATTEKLIKFGITPSLQIVDGLEKRTRRDVPSANVKTDLSCNNPPAEITTDSIKTIKKAFQSAKPARIVVNGEEDLLVLPAVVYAPEKSIVLYGQPNEGMVIVSITEETRSRAQSIMDLMN